MIFTVSSMSESEASSEGLPPTASAVTDLDTDTPSPVGTSRYSSSPLKSVTTTSEVISPVTVVVTSSDTAYMTPVTTVADSRQSEHGNVKTVSGLTKLVRCSGEPSLEFD